jgi:hypothetical protein
MDVQLTIGFVTDYDDFYLWVEDFEEGASAALIGKDEDGEAISYTQAEIVKIVDHSDYESEEDYDEATEELFGDESIDTMAEFMTAQGIYYVGVKNVGDEQSVESFDMDGAEYC